MQWNVGDGRGCEQSSSWPCARQRPDTPTGDTASLALLLASYRLSNCNSILLPRVPRLPLVRLVVATAATAYLFSPHFRVHFSRPTVSKLRLCSVLALAGAVCLVWPIYSAQLSHTISSTRLTALIPHLHLAVRLSHI